MYEFESFMEKKLGGKYNVSREAGGGGGQGGGEGGGRGGARGGGGGSVLDALLPKKVNEVMEKELLDDSRAKQTRIISSNIGFLSNAQNVGESSQSSSESEEEPAEYGSSIDPKVGDQVEVVSVSGRNKVFNIDHGNILKPNQASTEASVGAHPPETSGAPLPETSAGPPPAKKRKNHTCVGITTDFQNFHMCGKNQTCVGIDNDHLNYHVCGFYHTCVDFTKYIRHVKVFGKNHTCVGKYKHVCVFPNTGW